MGCDIHLFAEGLLRIYPNQEKKWINIDHWYRSDGWAEIMMTENEGFDYINLIDGNRDYDLFYLLSGVRGSEELNNYPPISKPKGLPKQIDKLIGKFSTEYTEQENNDFHDASYLTLRELKDSGYRNLNLNLASMIERLEELKKERRIDNDEEVRIVFWFDS